MESIQASIDGDENHLLTAIMGKLYLKNEIADVYFVFGDDENCERVPAHKILLAAGSDVFKAMFYGELKEKGDVKITDASADAFKEFLQFFYRNKVNLTVENAFDVVNLVKKYDVAACHSICDRFLKNELIITNDSVCTIYSLATHFDLENVKKLCESKIVEDTEGVFESSSFLDCDRSLLSRILKLDKIYCSEFNVFHACMNWVKAKAKQEQVTKEMVATHLGDLFYDIRFGSMTLEEFVDSTQSYGQLFSSDEFREIVQMIRFEDFRPTIFKTNHRPFPVPQWNRNAVIACNRTIECPRRGKYVFKTVESTKFTVNKPILLGAIWCLAPNTNHLPVEMTIYEISNNVSFKPIYSDKNVIFENDASKEVALTRPILIKPRFQYEIQFKHSSATPLHYHRSKFRDKVQLRNTDIIVKFHGENKKEGIIDDLEFNLIPEA